MELSISRQGGAATVEVSGQVDALNAPKLQSRLLELVDNGVRSLIVDLTKITFMSDAGLLALLRAQIRLSNRRPPGTLRLILGNNNRLKRSLELVGMIYVFTYLDPDEIGD